MRACYLTHDGQKDAADGLFPEGFAELSSEFVFLSLEEVIREWRMWKELADSGEFAGEESQPDAGVRADWWNPRWLPFAWDGAGDSLCVDLLPAEGGTAGQVILHHHADDGRPKLPNGLRDLFESLAEHLEDADR